MRSLKAASLVAARHWKDGRRAAPYSTFLDPGKCRPRRLKNPAGLAPRQATFAQRGDGYLCRGSSPGGGGARQAFVAPKRGSALKRVLPNRGADTGPQAAGGLDRLTRDPALDSVLGPISPFFPFFPEEKKPTKAQLFCEDNR